MTDYEKISITPKVCEKIPPSVQLLNPTIYQEEDKYYCLLGFSREDGIYGFGKTPLEAMEDWDRAYNMKYSK